MAVRLSALRTSRAILPRNITCLLLVLISVTRLSKPQGVARPEGLGKIKKIIQLIGSQTRDLLCLNHYATACLQVMKLLSY
jgi:hypothetical protein